MSDRGHIEEFEKLLVETVGHNQNSDGQIAAQILFQKFLERGLVDILEGIELARVLSLAGKNVRVDFQNERVKFEVFLAGNIL